MPVFSSTVQYFTNTCFDIFFDRFDTNNRAQLFLLAILASIIVGFLIVAILYLVTDDSIVAQQSSKMLNCKSTIQKLQNAENDLNIVEENELTIKLRSQQINELFLKGKSDEIDFEVNYQNESHRFINGLQRLDDTDHVIKTLQEFNLFLSKLIYHENENVSERLTQIYISAVIKEFVELDGLALLRTLMEHPVSDVRILTQAMTELIIPEIYHK